MKDNLGGWYDKHYKKLLVIPAILIIFSLVYMAYFYNQNGDFLKRDVSLIGGTSITLKTDILLAEFEEKLSSQFPNIDIRVLADNSGKQTHLLITVPESKELIVSAINDNLGIEVNEDNASIEFTQGSLGEEFYKQLMTAMLFSFLLMALVVFITFGESKIIKIFSLMLTLISMKITFPFIGQISFIVVAGLLFSLIYGFFASNNKTHRWILFGIFVFSSIVFFFPYYPLIFLISIVCMIIYTKYSAPSIAVLIAAFADILLTVVTVNLFGIKIAAGGIIAFLMLIGYSVGTDVLLTSRVLRRGQESVNSACFGAFKTGIMLTVTAIVSILVGLIFVYRFETVLNQIFTIILIGLFYDILNTWFTNVWIIKWYAESRDKQGGNLK